jgi:large subunit ribosomal protein L21
MYAVIETGGKQYRVEVGTTLEVEHLDVEPGHEITLNRVLLVADGASASIGRPLVADAVVSAEVLRQDRGEKVIAFKYRPKARRRVKKGHRQELTVLRVTDVRLGERSAADDVRRAEAEEAAQRDRARELAAKQAAADAELAAKLAPATPAAEKPARVRGRAAPAKDEPETPTARGKAAPKQAAKPAAPTPKARGAKAEPKAADKPSSPRGSRPKKES